MSTEITLIAAEASVDVARTTLDNARAALATIVHPELVGVELRRLTNAFGDDPQWIIRGSLPTPDLVGDIPALTALLGEVAASCHRHMGWRRTVVTLSWRPAAMIVHASLTITFAQEAAS